MYHSSLGLHGAMQTVPATRDSVLRYFLISVDPTPCHPVFLWIVICYSTSRFFTVGVASDKTIGVVLYFCHAWRGWRSGPVLMLLWLLIELRFAFAAAVTQKQENDCED
jgi:hypothetical protein